MAPDNESNLDCLWEHCCKVNAIISSFFTGHFPAERYIVHVERFGLANESYLCSQIWWKNPKPLDHFLSRYVGPQDPDLLPWICGRPWLFRCFQSRSPLHWESLTLLAESICVIRLGLLDQMLSTVLSKPRIVLQFSQRERSGVNMSVAIHKAYNHYKGKRHTSTVQARRDGYSVLVKRIDSVACHLLESWTDHDLCERIRTFSLSHDSVKSLHTTTRGYLFLYYFSFGALCLFISLVSTSQWNIWCVLWARYRKEQSR